MSFTSKIVSYQKVSLWSNIISPSTYIANALTLLNITLIMTQSLRIKRRRGWRKNLTLGCHQHKSESFCIAIVSVYLLNIIFILRQVLCRLLWAPCEVNEANTSCIAKTSTVLEKHFRVRALYFLFPCWLKVGVHRSKATHAAPHVFVNTICNA